MTFVIYTEDNSELKPHIVSIIMLFCEDSKLWLTFCTL